MIQKSIQDSATMTRCNDAREGFPGGDIEFRLLCDYCWLLLVLRRRSLSLAFVEFYGSIMSRLPSLVLLHHRHCIF
jgi:hypothetical protein